MKPILSIYFYLLTFCVNAQLTQESDITLGGTDDDGSIIAIQTPDGGYLYGGSSASPAGGDKTEGAFGETDYWLIKLDADRNKEWDKIYGGIERDALWTIVHTGDGYLLGGLSQSGVSGNKTTPNFGGYDYWVVKIDLQGNMLWDKNYGGTGWDALYQIAIASDGNYLLGGYSSSGISGNKTLPVRGSIEPNDYWVIKIDGNGNKLWEKVYGGDETDYLRSLEVTSDGGFIVGGISRSNAGWEKSENSRGLSDYWVIKADNDGEVIWDKTYGGTKDDDLVAIKELPSGDFILFGWSRSDIGDEKSENSRGVRDYWLIKTDELGNKLWDKTYGGSENDKAGTGNCLIVDNDKGFLLGGSSNSDISNEKSENSRGGNDYWLVKTDSNGVLEWDMTIGGAGEDDLRNIIQEDCHYLLGGFSDSDISGDKSEDSKGGDDCWIVTLKDSCTLDSLIDTTSNMGMPIDTIVESSFFAPNAFTPNGDGRNDVFLIQGENIDEMELAIYNTFGEMVFYTENAQEGWDGKLSTQIFPPGVYVWHIIASSPNSVENTFQLKGNVTVIR